MAALRTLRVLRDLKHRSIFNKSWGLRCCMLMHKNAHQNGYCMVLLRLPQPLSRVDQLKQDRKLCAQFHMEDFEYSVEICDRDWECFFAECEECNLLPPSLAGVDDSGMSDIDDTGSVLAQRAQRINPPQSFSENRHHIDGPPDCDGSPAEHCIDKHGLGRLDSVLSGSEEDIHLQSVNMFFERLKSLSEAEPSKERVGNNREAIKEEKQCGDGYQPSRSNLPKNSPKSNTLPASGETAAGNDTMKPVDTIRSINAVKNISFEPAACSDSELKACKLAEVELFIREDAFAEPKVNRETQQNQQHDLIDTIETTLQSSSVEMCRNMDDIKLDGLLADQVILRKKCGPKEDLSPSQESSPSSSIRRKRKKKKRLSVEAGDGGQPWERQASVKPSDSEEEQYASRERAGVILSQDSFLLNEPLKNTTYLLTPYSTTSNLSLNLSANEIKNDVSNTVPSRDGQHLPFTLTEAKLSQGVRAASSTLNQSNGTGVMSTAINGNEATPLQPCSKLQVEDSGWNKNKNQEQDVKAEDLQQSDNANMSNVCFEKEQIPKYSTTEVKSVGGLPCAESCAPTVDVSQNDKLSAAKSVLAAETGNSGREEHMQCQNGAEPQEQLESDCHHTNQSSRTPEKTHLAPSAVVGISSQALPLKTSDGEICTKLITDFVNQSPHRSLLAKNLSSLDKEEQINIGVEAPDSPSEKNTKTEGTPAETSLTLMSTNHSETNLSLSEDLKTSHSDVTHVTSCCTLDTESLTSLSNENLTDMSASYYSSAGEHESGGQEEKKVPTLAEHKETDAMFEPKSQPESKCDFLGEAENVITASTAVAEDEKMENSVFAMSSFWSEMEKLTINDILGLRKISKASPPSSLTPVQESEETDTLAVSNPRIFTEVKESKLKQATGKTPSSSRSVTWESEPVTMSQGGNIYPVNAMLASVIDTPQPVLTEKTQQCFKKISKTISVHNLQALESDSSSYLYQDEILQTIDDRESENFGYFTEDSAPKQDTDSYSISLTDIFKYLFGGKRSVPHQSANDDMATHCIAGNSVSETYDDFFSEFDTESFFYPLVTAEEKNQDKPVPIFSYSRSTGRNLQFPEAYEYFFASSSSDDSSVESDEEDNCCPVRVVSRFTRKASSTNLSTDVYEDFFTERDFRENFFCLKSLSFRNIKFASSAAQKQSSNSMSLIPVRENSRSNLRAGAPLDTLGNQDVMLPDPLLYYLEDRISRQLAQHSFKYEDLQATVSNPGLDAPLLPFKQSDMCLVCIAFASWVLKTANPQVGDAWKAVLLANVSALSAIRYLRKYVKAQAVAGEMKTHHPALTYS